MGEDHVPQLCREGEEVRASRRGDMVSGHLCSGGI
jgi:hypothetical protein